MTDPLADPTALRTPPTLAARIAGRLGVLAVAVAPLVVCGILVLNSREDQLQAGRDAAAANAMLLREHALKTIEMQRVVVGELEARIEGRAWDDVQADEALHRRMAELVASVQGTNSAFAADGDGRVRIVGRSFPAPSAFIGDLTYFQELARGADEALSTPHIGRVTGVEVFTLGRALRRDGRFDGVVGISMRIDEFERLFAATAVNPRDAVVLRHVDGTAVVRYPRDEEAARKVGPGTALMRSIAAAPERGAYETVSVVDGVRRAYAYEKVGQYPLYVIYGTDLDAALEPWRADAAWAATLALIASASAGGLVGVLRRRTRSAERLAAAEEHLAALERADAALRRSEERLRLAIEGARLGAWEADLVTGERHWSPEARALFGMAPDAPASLDSFLEAVHPEDRAAVQEAHRAALAVGSEGLFVVEFRRAAPAADGGPVWLATRGRALFEEGRPVRLAGVCYDVTDRRRAEDALRLGEARFRGLVEALPNFAWTARPDGWVEYQSPRWYEYSGQVEGGAAPTSWLDHIHPEDSERARGIWRLALAGGQPYETEFRLRARDGSYRWFLVRAVTVSGPDGQAERWVGTCTDIDALRRAEAARALLIREVDHRAKNALAVVQSLIRLTRADNREGFVASVEGRIGALARAHALLAANRWGGARLRDIVAQELEPHGDGQAECREGTRVRLDGPAVTLVPDAAQPLSMILHELATNSAKHGALSVPEGRVEVTWRSVPDGGLVLTWRESGGPPVSPLAARGPARRGFGTTVMEASAGQLGGQLSRDWRPEGLLCRLALPASQVGGSDDDGFEFLPEANPAPAEPPRGLAGARVLAVEDDALVALVLEGELEAMGCEVVGARTLEDALRLARMEILDYAVLDLNLRGESALPVAELLESRGVPFLFATGYGAVDPGGRWAGRPLMRKPYSPADLAASLGALAARESLRLPA
ncbi:MAG TPA: PAS domain-containing protein [Azospirillaceae bacterium]|nr:PAS domain-containing protein [Azospirillaceae bacterium]